ncbi:helix-turn-helix domain-containing protein [Mycolicibacterium sp. S2-37]|uniref:helix-turn-helix domain-containing protein n=1 Tax=Mycolicibacterium sp. S2-37 TaxID=2810297 RepID=UPI001A9485BD|nr:helix-turn-helix domain-containing protein [Mycolicibacterium sp. S2-37]MBO0679668.1 helix-turn-helix domain-containing protein [Mycolicibacterium sp. S2-37]
MSATTPVPLEGWLDALAEIGAAVGGDEPVSDLLNRVAQTACALLDFDFCGVFLPDGTGRALTIVGSHGLSSEYVAQVNADRPILLDVRGDAEAPTSIAYRTGEVVWLADIELQPGFGWGGVAHEQGYRALISAPLLRAGTVIGALNGYRTIPHRFDAAEISLVTTLATQVAIALGTAQLRAREQDTIRELRRAEEVHALLTATALRGEGVTGVAAALAELLERPVLIEGAYGEVLAATDGETPPTPVQPDLDALLAAGEVLAVDGGTVAGVVLDGSVVARMHVHSPRSDLSSLDVRAIEHAAVVTALELLRARTAAEVEQRLRGSLVADLLSADGGDLAGLPDRARRLGWDPSGAHVLVAVRCGETPQRGGRPAAERLLAAADRLVSGLSPKPLVATHRGDLVLVLADQSGAENARHLAGRLVDSILTTGVSSGAVAAVAPPAPATDLAAMFRTLRGALALGAQSDSTTVIDLRETGLDHLLLQLDDPVRLRAFARAVLGPAIDYDRTRATELLGTARVLLDHDLDRRAAAAALHLHPNTVQQRMRRLEDLTGLRLSRPRDLLQLTAALTVAQIAGLG